VVSRFDPLAEAKAIGDYLPITTLRDVVIGA
jgi:hypothetical protein